MGRPTNIVVETTPNFPWIRLDSNLKSNLFFIVFSPNILRWFFSFLYNTTVWRHHFSEKIHSFRTTVNIVPLWFLLLSVRWNLRELYSGFISQNFFCYNPTEMLMMISFGVVFTPRFINQIRGNKIYKISFFLPGWTLCELINLTGCGISASQK